MYSYLLAMYNDVKYFLYYSSCIFCVTDIHSCHVRMNIFDVQNPIFIYTTIFHKKRNVLLFVLIDITEHVSFLT